MDFILVFIIYISVFAVSMVLYLFGDHPVLNQGVLGQLKENVTQAFWKLIPRPVVTVCSEVVNYIFNTRNHVMQCLFAVLVLLGHIVWILDMLTVFYLTEPDLNHTFVPISLCFINLVFFHLSCTTRPGEITARNIEKMLSFYEPDDVLYKSGVTCSTCKLIKPARSKHCRLCNMCVPRFDHHCIWTNSCVGAGSIRYFNGFLISLVVMCINGAYVCLRCLVLIVHHLRLLDTAYVDPKSGSIKPVTVIVLMQHLFMEYPRIVFLATTLPVLVLLIGAFMCYHLYLVFSNQTTNERYKLSDLANKHFLENGNKLERQKILNMRPYDQGVMKNIGEVLFPFSFTKAVKIKRR